MFVMKVFFPLFLMMVIWSPSSSLGLLYPPDISNNDYPLYDFPSVQYYPRNTLHEYQDPRLQNDEDDQEEEKMQVATRSTYFPISSSHSSSSSSLSSSPSSSSSSSSYPYPPASSSSETIPCTSEDIAKMLNTEDLDKMIKIVAKIEGKSVKEILLKLAVKHGLHLKGGRRGSSVVPPPEPLRNLQLLESSAAPQRPLVHLRRPPKGLPPQTQGRGRPIVDEGDRFEPVAIEVAAVSSRGGGLSSLSSLTSSSGPMRLQALLVVEDASRQEVARTPVDLGPRMALLDVLKEAKVAFALDNGPYPHNPFAFKARRVESERCLGIQAIGRVGASPNSALQISVTRTRPIAQVVWDSSCLPRVSELLVRRGDIIFLAPR